MTSPALYELNEHRIRVSSDDPDVSSLFQEYLAGFAVDEFSAPASANEYFLENDGGLIRIWFDGNEVQPSVPLWAAADKILREASSAAVLKTTRYLGIHAGAVSLNGVGVILPAPSGSGKSTLTAALAQAGFQYLTDEAALIDLPSGSMKPFPRPLSLHPRSLEALKPLSNGLPLAIDWPDGVERQIAPRQLGWTPESGTPPLRAIILPRFDPAGPTTCEPIRRSDALIALIKNAFNFARFADDIESAADIVRHAQPYRLVFDDLDTAAGRVLEVVNQIAVSPAYN